MPSTDVEPTGERVLVEHYQSSIGDYAIYLMHIASYQFAEQFGRAKRVLDYGCGSGYGSASIARVAEKVDAVDVSADALADAEAKFRAANLHFRCVAPDRPLPFADGSFDLVLSFQVLEHVEDVDFYLDEVRRVLIPGGTLLLVTPNRRERLFSWQRPWNRWHLREFSRATLSARLRRFFANVEMQQMTGAAGLIDTELRRYRMAKWLMLPFTLPIGPDALRVAGLNMVHGLRRRRTVTPVAKKFPFDVSAIRIGPDLSPSLNLVAIARKALQPVLPARDSAKWTEQKDAVAVQARPDHGEELRGFALRC